ncbi:hypothetical protein, partial [Nocardia carnea]|uniref:hypothetical protein n=1 Tax=Nocardia carnea TaxID=37328 RepID=UPI002453F396
MGTPIGTGVAEDAADADSNVVASRDGSEAGGRRSEPVSESKPPVARDSDTGAQQVSRETDIRARHGAHPAESGSPTDDSGSRPADSGSPTGEFGLGAETNGSGSGVVAGETAAGAGDHGERMPDGGDSETVGSGRETGAESTADRDIAGDEAGGAGLPPGDTGAVPVSGGRGPVDVIAALSNTLATRHPGGLIQRPGRVDAAGVDMRALEQVFDGNFVRAGTERGATPRQEQFRLRLLAWEEERRLERIGYSMARDAKKHARRRDELVRVEVDDMSRTRAGLAAGRNPGVRIEAGLADTARSRGIDTSGIHTIDRWTAYADMLGEQIEEKQSAREQARKAELAAGAKAAEDYTKRAAEEKARLLQLAAERKRIRTKEWRRRSTPDHLRESLEELGPGGTLVVVEEFGSSDANGVNARPYVLYLDGDTVMVDDWVSGGPAPFDFAERAGIERTFVGGIRGDGTPSRPAPASGSRRPGPAPGAPAPARSNTAVGQPDTVADTEGDTLSMPGRPDQVGDGTAHYRVDPQFPEQVDAGTREAVDPALAAETGDQSGAAPAVDLAKSQVEAWELVRAAARSAPEVFERALRVLQPKHRAVVQDLIGAESDALGAAPVLAKTLPEVLAGTPGGRSPRQLPGAVGPSAHTPEPAETSPSPNAQQVLGAVGALAHTLARGVPTPEEQWLIIRESWARDDGSFDAALAAAVEELTAAGTETDPAAVRELMERIVVRPAEGTVAEWAVSPRELRKEQHPFYEERKAISRWLTSHTEVATAAVLGHVRKIAGAETVDRWLESQDPGTRRLVTENLSARDAGELAGGDADEAKFRRYRAVRELLGLAEAVDRPVDPGRSVALEAAASGDEAQPVGQLRADLAELPSPDPDTKPDLGREAGERFTAAAEKVLAVFDARRAELLGESWQRRRAVMEGPDETEALLRYVAAVRAETGFSPRANQIKAFLLGRQGYMRQMGTGQGKTLVGWLDSLHQLSRGEPVELADGEMRRVHHVLTTTELLADDGIRESAGMFRRLGYEVSRWDPDNPAELAKSTVVYLTYDERATAELKDSVPPGRTATIDEADAVLIHNQTEHHLSDGERAPVEDTEKVHVWAVRDHLKQMLAKRVLTHADYRADSEPAVRRASELWEEKTGRPFTERESEMARAFFDLKAGQKGGRLVQDWHFQVFDGKVQILDENGKPMSDPKVNTDSRWFGGRHQMVEAIYDLDVYSDGEGSKRVGVTDVLSKYDRLSLMSGTLERTAAEIKQNFPVHGGLGRVEDHQESRLVAEEDRIFLTQPEMLKDAVAKVRTLQDQGRPVAIIARPDLAVKFSRVLTHNGIDHEAIHGRWFAEHRDNNLAQEKLGGVKTRAGRASRVTVGVDGMLGRGWDPTVGEQVNEAGGLHVQKLGRSDNPDTDAQAAARAGRNGQNGSYGFSDALDGGLANGARNRDYKIGVTHYRNGRAEHATATREYAEAVRAAETNTSAAAAEAQARMRSAQDRVEASENTIAAAERRIRRLIPLVQDEAAERARIARESRRMNQPHAPPVPSAPQHNADREDVGVSDSDAAEADTGGLGATIVQHDLAPEGEAFSGPIPESGIDAPDHTSDQEPPGSPLKHVISIAGTGPEYQPAQSDGRSIAPGEPVRGAMARIQQLDAEIQELDAEIRERADEFRRQGTSSGSHLPRRVLRVPEYRLRELWRERDALTDGLIAQVAQTDSGAVRALQDRLVRTLHETRARAEAAHGRLRAIATEYEVPRAVTDVGELLVAIRGRMDAADRHDIDSSRLIQGGLTDAEFLVERRAARFRSGADAYEAAIEYHSCQERLVRAGVRPAAVGEAGSSEFHSSELADVRRAAEASVADRRRRIVADLRELTVYAGLDFEGEIRTRNAETRIRNAESGIQKAETRKHNAQKSNRKAEIRKQKRLIRSLEAEIRDQKDEIRKLKDGDFEAEPVAEPALENPRHLDGRLTTWIADERREIALAAEDTVIAAGAPHRRRIAHADRVERALLRLRRADLIAQATLWKLTDQDDAARTCMADYESGWSTARLNAREAVHAANLRMRGIAGVDLIGESAGLGEEFRKRLKGREDAVRADLAEAAENAGGAGQWRGQGRLDDPTGGRRAPRVLQMQLDEIDRARLAFAQTEYEVHCAEVDLALLEAELPGSVNMVWDPQFGGMEAGGTPLEKALGRTDSARREVYRTIIDRRSQAPRRLAEIATAIGYPDELPTDFVSADPMRVIPAVHLILWFRKHVKDRTTTNEYTAGGEHARQWALSLEAYRIERAILWTAYDFMRAMADSDILANVEIGPIGKQAEAEADQLRAELEQLMESQWFRDNLEFLARVSEIDDISEFGDPVALAEKIGEYADAHEAKERHRHADQVVINAIHVLIDQAQLNGDIEKLEELEALAERAYLAAEQEARQRLAAAGSEVERQAALDDLRRVGAADQVDASRWPFEYFGPRFTGKDGASAAFPDRLGSQQNAPNVVDGPGHQPREIVWLDLNPESRERLGTIPESGIDTPNRTSGQEPSVPLRESVPIAPEDPVADAVEPESSPDAGARRAELSDARTGPAGSTAAEPSGMPVGNGSVAPGDAQTDSDEADGDTGGLDGTAAVPAEGVDTVEGGVAALRGHCAVLQWERVNRGRVDDKLVSKFDESDELPGQSEIAVQQSYQAVLREYGTGENTVPALGEIRTLLGDAQHRAESAVVVVRRETEDAEGYGGHVFGLVLDEYGRVVVDDPADPAIHGRRFDELIFAGLIADRFPDVNGVFAILHDGVGQAVDADGNPAELAEPALSEQIARLGADGSAVRLGAMGIPIGSPGRVRDRVVRDRTPLGEIAVWARRLGIDLTVPHHEPGPDGLESTVAAAFGAEFFRCGEASGGFRDAYRELGEKLRHHNAAAVVFDRSRTSSDDQGNVRIYLVQNVRGIFQVEEITAGRNGSGVPLHDVIPVDTWKYIDVRALIVPEASGGTEISASPVGAGTADDRAQAVELSDEDAFLQALDVDESGRDVLELLGLLDITIVHDLLDTPGYRVEEIDDPGEPSGYGQQKQIVLDASLELPEQISALTGYLTDALADSGLDDATAEAWTIRLTGGPLLDALRHHEYGRTMLELLDRFDISVVHRNALYAGFSDDYVRDPQSTALRRIRSTIALDANLAVPDQIVELASYLIEAVESFGLSAAEVNTWTGPLRDFLRNVSQDVVSRLAAPLPAEVASSRVTFEAEAERAYHVAVESGVPEAVDLGEPYLWRADLGPRYHLWVSGTPDRIATLSDKLAGFARGRGEFDQRETATGAVTLAIPFADPVALGRTLREIAEFRTAHPDGFLPEVPVGVQPVPDCPGVGFSAIPGVDIRQRLRELELLQLPYGAQVVDLLRSLDNIPGGRERAAGERDVVLRARDLDLPATGGPEVVQALRDLRTVDENNPSEVVSGLREVYHWRRPRQVNGPQSIAAATSYALHRYLAETDSAERSFGDFLAMLRDHLWFAGIDPARPHLELGDAAFGAAEGDAVPPHRHITLPVDEQAEQVVARVRELYSDIDMELPAGRSGPQRGDRGLARAFRGSLHRFGTPDQGYRDAYTALGRELLDLGPGSTAVVAEPAGKVYVVRNITGQLWAEEPEGRVRGTAYTFDAAARSAGEVRAILLDDTGCAVQPGRARQLAEALANPAGHRDAIEREVNRLRAEFDRLRAHWAPGVSRNFTERRFRELLDGDPHELVVALERVIRRDLGYRFTGDQRPLHLLRIARRLETALLAVDAGSAGEVARPAPLELPDTATSEDTPVPEPAGRESATPGQRLVPSGGETIRQLLQSRWEGLKYSTDRGSDYWRRLTGLFDDDGTCVIVALDHALTDGPVVRDAKEFSPLIRAVHENGANGVFLHRGNASRFDRTSADGLVLHVTGGPVIGEDVGRAGLVRADPNHKVLLGSAESIIREAKRLDVDAVSVHVNVGSLDNAEQEAEVAELGRALSEADIPLIIMSYPRGPGISPDNLDHVLTAVSQAVLLGADIVKTSIPKWPDGTVDTELGPIGGTPNLAAMQAVVASSQVPVVFAGGSNWNIPMEQVVAAVRESGAAGLAVGRMVFRNPDNLSPGTAMRLVDSALRGDTAPRIPDKGSDPSTWESWAEKRYDAARADDTDVGRIATYLAGIAADPGAHGLSPEDVAHILEVSGVDTVGAIKNHLYFTEHNLIDERTGEPVIARFRANHLIAEAWRDLSLGYPLDRDTLMSHVGLLRHEVAEQRFEARWFSAWAKLPPFEIMHGEANGEADWEHRLRDLLPSANTDPRYLPTQSGGQLIEPGGSDRDADAGPSRITRIRELDAEIQQREAEIRRQGTLSSGSDLANWVLRVPWYQLRELWRERDQLTEGLLTEVALAQDASVSAQTAHGELVGALDKTRERAEAAYDRLRAIASEYEVDPEIGDVPDLLAAIGDRMAAADLSDIDHSDDRKAKGGLTDVEYLVERRAARFRAAADMFEAAIEYHASQERAARAGVRQAAVGAVGSPEFHSGRVADIRRAVEAVVAERRQRIVADLRDLTSYAGLDLEAEIRERTEGEPEARRVAVAALDDPRHLDGRLTTWIATERRALALAGHDTGVAAGATHQRRTAHVDRVERALLRLRRGDLVAQITAFELFDQDHAARTHTADYKTEWSTAYLNARKALHTANLRMRKIAGLDPLGESDGRAEEFRQTLEAREAGLRAGVGANLNAGPETASSVGSESALTGTRTTPRVLWAQLDDLDRTRKNLAQAEYAVHCAEVELALLEAELPGSVNIVRDPGFWPEPGGTPLDKAVRAAWDARYPVRANAEQRQRQTARRRFADIAAAIGYPDELPADLTGADPLSVIDAAGVLTDWFREHYENRRGSGEFRDLEPARFWALRAEAYRIERAIRWTAYDYVRGLADLDSLENVAITPRGTAAEAAADRLRAELERFMESQPDLGELHVLAMTNDIFEFGDPVVLAEDIGTMADVRGAKSEHRQADQLLINALLVQLDLAHLHGDIDKLAELEVLADSAFAAAEQEARRRLEAAGSADDRQAAVDDLRRVGAGDQVGAPPWLLEYFGPRFTREAGGSGTAPDEAAARQPTAPDALDGHGRGRETVWAALSPDGVARLGPNHEPRTYAYAWSPTPDQESPGSPQEPAPIAPEDPESESGVAGRHAEASSDDRIRGLAGLDGCIRWGREWSRVWEDLKDGRSHIERYAPRFGYDAQDLLSADMWRRMIPPSSADSSDDPDLEELRRVTRGYHHQAEVLQALNNDLPTASARAARLYVENHSEALDTEGVQHLVAKLTQLQFATLTWDVVGRRRPEAAQTGQPAETGSQASAARSEELAGELRRLSNLTTASAGREYLRSQGAGGGGGPPPPHPNPPAPA